MIKRNGYNEILNDLKIEKETFFNIGFKNIIGLNDELYQKKVKEKAKLFFSEKGEKIYYRENNGKLKEHYDIIRKEIFYEYECIESDDSKPIVKIVIDCLKKENNKSTKKINYINIKKEYLQDYDLTHLWDATQNPLLYSLPWNYYYMPKMIAPITDRNVRYDKDRVFLKRIMKTVIKKYKDEINLYNEFMKNKEAELKKYYYEKILTDDNIKDNQTVLNSFKTQFYYIDIENKNLDNLYKEYIIK